MIFQCLVGEGGPIAKILQYDRWLGAIMVNKDTKVLHIVWYTVAHTDEGPQKDPSQEGPGGALRILRWGGQSEDMSALTHIKIGTAKTTLTPAQNYYVANNGAQIIDDDHIYMKLGI